MTVKEEALCEKQTSLTVKLPQKACSTELSLAGRA